MGLLSNERGMQTISPLLVVEKPIPSALLHRLNSLTVIIRGPLSLRPSSPKLRRIRWRRNDHTMPTTKTEIAPAQAGQVNSVTDRHAAQTRARLWANGTG